MRKDAEERKTKRKEERRRQKEKRKEKKSKKEKRRLRWVLYRNIKTHSGTSMQNSSPPPSLLKPRFPEAHKIFEYVESVSKGVGHSS